MKKMLLAAFAVAFVSTGAYALEMSFLSGDVSVMRGGAKVSNVNVGTKIRSKDTIITGKKAIASLAYSDGSVIQIKENTSLTIGNMPESSDAAPVSVVKGIVVAKFTKISKGSEARRIYTPTTVAAVRGTEFQVAVSDGADSRVELTEGKLDVHNPYGGQDIEAGQNIETGVAEAPQAAPGSGDIERWKSGQDEKLSADAEGKSEKFSAYMGDFSARGSKASIGIDSLNKNLSAAKDSKAVDACGNELAKVSASVEDDMYLSAAASDSISAITDRFKNDKTEMYDKFLTLKEESNKVKEQQQRNHEAIQAVKAAYSKARDEILNRQKEDKKKIKAGADMQKVKPVIEKKPVSEK
ncbi:MAG: FecR family protein [Spirochaetota bacterium]